VFDVRRFTALDMYGSAGTRRRRQVIRAEFLIGCPALLVLGALSLLNGQLLVGGWFLGVGVNYVPLAVYSVILFPPGRLEAELAAVGDVRAQLIRAGAVQALLLVPFLVAAAAAAQHHTRHRR